MLAIFLNSFDKYFVPSLDFRLFSCHEENGNLKLFVADFDTLYPGNALSMFCYYKYCHGNV